MCCLGKNLSFSSDLAKKKRIQALIKSDFLKKCYHNALIISHYFRKNEKQRKDNIVTILCKCVCVLFYRDCEIHFRFAKKTDTGNFFRASNTFFRPKFFHNFYVLFSCSYGINFYIIFAFGDP